MSGKAPEPRACPFCYTDMPTVAIMCAHCGKFSKPISFEKSSFSLIRSINDAIARWEADNSQGIERIVKVTARPVTIPKWLRVALSSVALACSLAFFVIWFGPHGGFASGRAALAFVAVGIGLLAGSRLLRDPKVLPTTNEANVPGIRALGYTTEIVLVQSVAIIVMITLAFMGKVAEAQWAAYAGIALVFPLFNTSVRMATVALGTIATLFVFGLWLINDIDLSIMAGARVRSFSEFIIPFGSIAWIILTIAVVPQLQLLRMGRLGIGRFKGDLLVPIWGSYVPVAITTAVMLVSAYGVISELPYLPGWIMTAFTG